ncbi:MAG: hypothetical protein PHO18_06005 [Synergistaceae bacterium]|nr:hypothetical protein [Synergistaceae bacterium]
MINLQLFFSKKYILATLTVVVSLLMLQFFVISQAIKLKEQSDAIDFETKTLDRVFERRSDTVMKYKRALKFNYDMMPAPVESPTHFYALIVSIMTSAELKGFEVTKASETKEMISFNVKCEANYFSMLDLLVSFRQSSYMMRVTELNVKALDSGIVAFSFNVQAKVAADAAKENTGKAAGVKK